MAFKIAFTGHRPQKLGGFDNSINKRNHFLSLLGNFILSEPYIQKYMTGELVFITGMAQGVDQWATELAVEWGVPFDAYIPCYDQQKTWPLEAQRHYWNLVIKARSIIQVSSEDYRPELMQRRNEAMVDNCDMLFAYWDGSGGGTSNCVRYARQVGKPVEMFEPNDMV